MNTEVRVPNADGALIAGMYAQVGAHAAVAAPRLRDPRDRAVQRRARLARRGGRRDASEIQLVPIVIERDTGAAVEVASGLTGNERVVKLASAQFVDGLRVEVAQPGK